MLVGALCGDNVGSRDFRHRVMKSRVEDRSHRQRRSQSLARRMNSGDGRGIVQWRQTIQFLELGQHTIVDHDGLDEKCTAVDYTMAHRVNALLVCSHPLDDRAHGLFMIARVDPHRLRVFFSAGFDRENRIGAEAIDHANGKLAAVFVTIGHELDELELYRRAAAIEHQDIHVKINSKRIFSEIDPYNRLALNHTTAMDMPQKNALYGRLCRAGCR